MGCWLVLGLSTGCHLTGKQYDGCCDAAPGLESRASLSCDGTTCDDITSCDAWLGDADVDSCDGWTGGPSPRLVRGRRIKLLDETASTLGFINKIALWDKRADNHRISPQTERQVLSYLRNHQLDSVLVRSNQYDPLGEWRRLVANKRMAAPWKYTIGTYDWLKYTLVPGRLVGGDWYSPFTDSLHLYSDIPSLGLVKAAYAKDVHRRTYQGTYVSFQNAPVIGLWHETLANREVLRYLKQSGDPAALAEAKRILYPDFAGTLGAQALGFVPGGSVYGRAAGALAGHAFRRMANVSPNESADDPHRSTHR
ncbi:hypothetical protein FYK55_27425 [Roseiconus nitratireducens]|uniref:Uncharacterized protein n=2 Tax=Roseiconus nitratireducens TaxID=2605748 RepID=A0A5M6CU33_9BACT|nr:hypothetical protein FYK55_27425 [Roseiconus nitratireducens]